MSAALHFFRILTLAVCFAAPVAMAMAAEAPAPAEAPSATAAVPEAPQEPESPAAPAPPAAEKPKKKTLWAGGRRKDAEPTEEEKKTLWAASKSKGTVVMTETFEGTAPPEDWSLMRLQFGIEEGRLSVMPAVRAGFDYGADKAGRSAAAFTHAGDTVWRDYRVEMDVYGGEADKLGLTEVDACMRGGFSVYFRAASYPEKWQDPARSAYALTFNPYPQLCEGKALPDAALYRVNDWFLSRSQKICRLAEEDLQNREMFSPAVTQNAAAVLAALVSRGYVEPAGRITNRIIRTRGPEYMQIGLKSTKDAAALYDLVKSKHCLVPGATKRLKSADPRPWKTDEPNRVVIDVRGSLIVASVNGVPVLQYSDTDPDALHYGGVGVEWAWDNMGWIDNVVVTKY